MNCINDWSKYKQKYPIIIKYLTGLLVNGNLIKPPLKLWHLVYCHFGEKYFHLYTELHCRSAFEDLKTLFSASISIKTKYKMFAFSVSRIWLYCFPYFLYLILVTHPFRRNMQWRVQWSPYFQISEIQVGRQDM